MERKKYSGTLEITLTDEHLQMPSIDFNIEAIDFNIEVGLPKEFFLLNLNNEIEGEIVLPQL